MVPGAAARRPAQLRTQLAIAQQPLEQSAQPRIEDLAHEMLEEALQLVEVAIGDGQEVRRIGLAVGDAGDRRQLDLQLVAEALNAPAHPHKVAALEAPGEHVGIAKRPPGDRAGAIAQLEGQVRRPGARDEAVLTGARVHGIDRLAGAQRRHRTGREGRRLDG